MGSRMPESQIRITVLPGIVSLVLGAVVAGILRLADKGSGTLGLAIIPASIVIGIALWWMSGLAARLVWKAMFVSVLSVFQAWITVWFYYFTIYGGLAGPALALLGTICVAGIVWAIAQTVKALSLSD